MERKQFLFMAEWCDVLSALEAETRARMYEMIANYGAKGILPTDISNMELALFTMFKNAIDATNEKYEEVSNARREAAKKRWNATEENEVKETDTQDANGCKTMQTDAKRCKRMQNDATSMQNDAPVLFADAYNTIQYNTSQVKTSHNIPPVAPPQGDNSGEGDFLNLNKTEKKGAVKSMQELLDEVPKDATKRNTLGLVQALFELKLSALDVTDILRKSNYGEIGHPVWQALATLNGGYKVKNRAAYIYSVLKK